MTEHPLSPLADAMQSSVVKGLSYFMMWIAGINTPQIAEALIFRGIVGRVPMYDEESVGVLTLTLVSYPLGFFILSSHIIIFALFVCFSLRYVWILWPLLSGIFWRILYGGRY